MDIFGFNAAKDLVKLQIENPEAATKLIAKQSLIAGAVQIVAAAGIFAAASLLQGLRTDKETQDENSDTDE